MNLLRFPLLLLTLLPAVASPLLAQTTTTTTSAPTITITTPPVNTGTNVVLTGTATGTSTTTSTDTDSDSDAETDTDTATDTTTVSGIKAVYYQEEGSSKWKKALLTAKGETTTTWVVTVRITGAMGKRYYFRAVDTAGNESDTVGRRFRRGS